MYRRLVPIPKPLKHCLFSYSKILQLEEDFVANLCADIIRAKPDLVITEKGVSDLAQHFLVRAGIAAIRRVRKSDNNRIAR
jgi:T-complex protein 1 subunit gamma